MSAPKLKSVSGPTPPDPSKPVTERFGGRYLTAEEYTAAVQTFAASRRETEGVEYVEMNLRHLLDESPDVPTMTTEDLGRLMVLADLAEANGTQLVAWAESIRSTAISLYWEKIGPDNAV